MDLKDLSEQIKRTFGDVHPAQYGQMNKYFISKLKEALERLRKQNLIEPVKNSDGTIRPSFSAGYNARNNELNAQIDAELKGLEE